MGDPRDRAGMAGAVLAGCASIDPTDPSHFTSVAVRNDTTQNVQLIQCDTTCGTLHDRQTLTSGQTTDLKVSAEGIKDGYVVADSDGHRLGCLYFDYNGHQPGLHR